VCCNNVKQVCIYIDTLCVYVCVCVCVCVDTHTHTHTRSLIRCHYLNIVDSLKFKIDSLLKCQGKSSFVIAFQFQHSLYLQLPDIIYLTKLRIKIERKECLLFVSFF